MWSRNEAKRAMIIVVNVQRLFRANRGGSNKKVDLSLQNPIVLILEGLQHCQMF